MRTVGHPASDEKVYTVSEITSALKDLVEERFPYLWIVGEVSNVTLHSSGHIYFKLKDNLAQIDCALFRSSRASAVLPEEGLKVLAQGRLSVYGARGRYELVVSAMLPAGRGELFAAFNELKARLEKEGLFDPSRKRPLPRFPSRLGVVTSPTGAAVRDVIRVARRIYAGVEIVVNPVRVQGDGAAEEVAAAIGQFNAAGGVDVIILARGGGSIEDLWAFNEEVVARAIVGSAIPVVSAVGHEIDYTIADFAADARAATPSAAPQLVLADYADVRTRIGALVGRAEAEVTGRIQRHRAFLDGLATRYGLRRIADRIVEASRVVDEAITTAERLTSGRIEAAKARLATALAAAESLSPLSTLRRGYAVCYKDDTRVRVTSYRQVRPGDLMRVIFARGGATCEVRRSGEDK